MGLFSSETKVTVATSFNRVIEDRLQPNSVKTGTIKGIFTEGGQIVENIMEGLISSIGSKSERLYRYGKTKYPYGAPTSKVYKSTQANSVTMAVLRQLEGRSLVSEYLRYGPLNRQHWGWQVLFDAYGYKPDTNELISLSGVKGLPVYLEDMQVIIAQENLANLTGTAFEQWGVGTSSGYTPLRPYSEGTSKEQTPIAVDSQVTNDYLKVTYVWKTPEGIQRDFFTLPMPIVEGPAEYVQVRYYYTTPNTAPAQGGVTLPPIRHTKFFTYRIGEGTYPDLDNLFTSEFDELGSFFPWGYFRYNKAPTSTDPRTTEYKAASRFMRYLGLDYAEVTKAVNSNPQVDSVDSAMLMMIVPAVSDDAVESHYRFEFFKGLYVQTGAVVVNDAPAVKSSDGLSRISQLLSGNTESTRISMVIKDARFSTSLNMSGIYRRLVPGNIGKVGSYSSFEGAVARTHSAVEYGASDAAGHPTETVITWTTSEKAHYYRHQISETIYEEIQVTGLRSTFLVAGSHSTSNTMVPIDHSISKKFSLPEREHLYARSLHYVFNSKQETEVAWYQQGWFSELLLVIAIVWTIFSMGSDGGTGLGAALAAGTATLEMIVVAIVVAGLEYLVINMVAQLFVKLLGPEFALLFAVVLAAYGMMSSYGSAEGVAGAPWAKDLLSLSNSIITKTGESYTKALSGLQEESDQFNIFAQNKMDELKKIQDELEGSRLISPFLLFGEAPTDYFNRTVHSGNIGIAGIDAISNYCDIALALPKLHQTILG